MVATKLATPYPERLFPKAQLSEEKKFFVSVKRGEAFSE